MPDNDGNWNNGNGWGIYKTEEYAQVLYKRAIGELEEMESSKAVAEILCHWAKDGDSILDVGCGVGHYLRSLRNSISCNFSYTGIDNSNFYIELAQKAFAGEDNVSFQTGDLYQLPFSEKSFDIVMSNNLFLHLPSIKTPLEELCRVSRRYVLIRTLVSERSFRIQEVRCQGDEFNEDGSPKSFNYYNIYSRVCIEHFLSKITRVEKWEIVPDNNFDPKRISEDAEKIKSTNITKIFNGWQVNSCILQPWAFIKIFL